MRSLYIGSTVPHAGKSLLCYGLGRLAQERGLRLGYFKPLGGNPSRSGDVVVDRDALFMAKALRLDEPLPLISPVVAEQPLLDAVLEDDGQGLLERVVEAHARLSADKDLLIVGGAGDLLEGKLLGLDGAAVVKRLAARALVVMSYQGIGGLDAVLWIREVLGERLLGVVINRVPPPCAAWAREKLTRYLERHGMPVLGVLPSDDVLESVSVGDLAANLSAEVLAGVDRLNVLVERVVIGAMNLESALKILRRARNKAVITGGDRADIQLASLETSTRCLILTGGHYPNEIILSKARESGVPVLLVRGDTFSTVERVEAIIGKLHPHEMEKLDRAAAMVGASLDFDRLLSLLEGAA